MLMIVILFNAINKADFKIKVASLRYTHLPYNHKTANPKAGAFANFLGTCVQIALNSYNF